MGLDARERVQRERAQCRGLVVRAPARPLHHRPCACGCDPGLPLRGVHQPAPSRAARRMSATPLLKVSDLRVTASDGAAIVDGVDFEVRAGEALGLAGESGCGKTTTALSVMRLLPPSLTQTGTITLKPEALAEEINVGRRTERGMQVVRWRHVSLVFQGAMNSLDPVQRVNEQIAEAISLHDRHAGKADIAARIEDLMSTVGLTATTARRYPHQLSGGQRQRAMVALALACSPPLVIADEPTTALDVVMQAQVLQLLERLREQLGLALILISYDLGVLAETC